MTRYGTEEVFMQTPKKIFRRVVESADSIAPSMHMGSSTTKHYERGRLIAYTRGNQHFVAI